MQRWCGALLGPVWSCRQALVFVSVPGQKSTNGGFRMAEDLSNWQPRPRPDRRVLEGRAVRLEPLDAARHGDGLFEAARAADADERFRYLFESPPADRAALQPWLESASKSEDPLFYAVVDKASGK